LATITPRKPGSGSVSSQATRPAPTPTPTPTPTPVGAALQDAVARERRTEPIELLEHRRGEHPGAGAELQHLPAAERLEAGRDVARKAASE
jgi:hypothetical protein